MAEEYGYVIEKNNNIIGKATKKDIVEKNLMHRGTTIYVFNSKQEILVTRRAKNKKLFPGLLEIGQGGSMIYGESFEEGAVRELEEELGIKNVKLKFIFDFFYRDGRVSFFAKTYQCAYDGKLLLQKEEIEGYFFVAVHKLKNLIDKEPERFSPDSLTQFREYLNVTSP